MIGAHGSALVGGLLCLALAVVAALLLRRKGNHDINRWGR